MTEQTNHPCPRCNRTLSKVHNEPYFYCVPCGQRYADHVITASVTAGDDAPAEHISKVHKGMERDLQNQVESWLTLQGYLTMAADNADRVDPVGWYGHWNGKRGTQGQPFMPDLIVLNANMTRCLMIELKVQPIKYRPGQREMIEAKRWWLATSLENFIEVVRAWEIVK